MKNSTVITAVLTAAIGTPTASEALAALPCYPPARFSLSATEVVDGKTGLTWQRGVAPAAKTWAEAKSYCPTVGANFRLPSVKELLTIVDFTKTNPAIDTTIFPGTAASSFWTSFTVAGLPNRAWYVNFYRGEASHYDVTNTYEVRCVR